MKDGESDGTDVEGVEDGDDDGDAEVVTEVVTVDETVVVAVVIEQSIKLPSRWESSALLNESTIFLQLIPILSTGSSATFTNMLPFKSQEILCIGAVFQPRT